MGVRGKVGWLVAAAMAYGWWASSNDQPPDRAADDHNVSRPLNPAVPKATSTKKPDAIARPSTISGGVQWLYTTAAVRVRAEPSTTATVLQTLLVGELIQSNGRLGDWHNVTVAAKVGWIRAAIS